MRPPKNRSFFLIGMAIVETMRHTGMSTLTNDISTQMNSLKVEELVEKPDFLQPPPPPAPTEIVKIYLTPNDPAWYPSLIKNGQKRSGVARVTSNTAPLKYFNNPRYFRRR